MRITFINSLFIGFILLQNCNSPETNMSATDQRVEDLLKQMTLEEKIGQLNLYNGTWDVTGPAPAEGDSKEKYDNIKKGLVGGMLNILTAEATREAQELAVENSRLGIPLIFGYDVVHGYKTMAPIPLAQAASWDPEVARKSNEVAALEASSAGVHWSYAPMIDVTRDPRWGRMMESPGEDPYLASRFAEAWVDGFQGEDLANPHTLAACAKHFAGYGFVEAGRDYNSADISLQTLYNISLPPFKAAAKAGVATVMNSFNEIAGVPATGSELLQRDLLKGDWEFSGFVVSDWASVGEMITHGFAGDDAEAAYKALKAGSDMDMEARVYERALGKVINDGQLDVSLVDDAVRRILKVKFDLGLFDDPYLYCDSEKEQNNLLTPDNLAASRDAAKKSIVLLKNKNNLLPLKKSGSIAVIGSLAESKDIPLGSWRAQAVTNSAVSLLEGIQSAVGTNAQVNYTPGYTLTEGLRSFTTELNIVTEDKSGFAKAIALAKSSDVVILAMGEDCWQTGEGRSQTSINLKGSQEDLLKELLKVNPNVVITLMNGRSLAIPYLAENAPAILEVWHLGSEAGNAIADVLFGDYNPSGKLPVSFPRNLGQVPIYYNHKNGGRPVPDGGNTVFWSHYTDAPNTPLFPFGYGLSYTNFEYSDFKLSKNQMSASETITVSVMVKNSGSVDGEEVVQFYIRDHVGSVTRPVKELKGFQKILLKAGEVRTLKFEISQETLSYYRLDLTFGTEPGDYTAMVGGNSEQVLSAGFELR
ncbi:MAG: beta-glucosidase BglX [Bacteroidetes bacterium]|nr:beta-glucosidase BglX [Bacteroidota bacterium]MDA1122413.1 beta-glucosidase BglX [Bacteroidota bacterium]